MRLKLYLIMTLWVVSFAACAMTITGMGWPFWASLIIFCMSSLHMARHERDYARDIEDLSDPLE